MAQLRNGWRNSSSAVTITWICRGASEGQSRPDYDFSNHSQFSVRDAYVSVNAGAGEGDPEAGRTCGQGRLRQTNTILRKLSNESGMYYIGGRTHDGVTSAIR